MEPLFSKEIKQAVEALLFVAGEPLPLSALAEYIESSEETVLEILKSLEEDYADRGFTLSEIAGGWQFMTAGSLHPYVERLYQPKMHRLSRAAMETLAIIAYCQPVTRSEIEEIRGVNADGIVSGLLEKGLLDEVGRKDTPGKPVLYGTNGKFLELLGLNSLEELPVVDRNALVEEPKNIGEDSEKEPELFPGEKFASTEQLIEEPAEESTAIEV